MHIGNSRLHHNKLIKTIVLLRNRPKGFIKSVPPKRSNLTIKTSKYSARDIRQLQKFHDPGSFVINTRCFIQSCVFLYLPPETDVSPQFLYHKKCSQRLGSANQEYLKPQGRIMSLRARMGKAISSQPDRTDRVITLSTRRLLRALVSTPA